MRPDSEVEPQLEEHLAHKQRKNHSAQSIRERRLTILRLARFFGHPLAEVTRDELRAWHEVRVTEIKPQSMHNEIGHIAVYMRWLNAEGVREDDPSAVLERPKHDRAGIPNPMPDGDIARALLAAPDPDVHAWIGLAAFCGMRCMEMAKLKAEDIIRSVPPNVRILGKGGYERVVPMPSTLMAELSAPPFPSTGYLFKRIDGRPGPPSAARVSERINAHLHQMGIKLTAHKLRHRFGTELYRATEDPFLVQQIMGHRSADTTKGYVKLANERASSAVEAISHLGESA